jgi:hypothetical protein
MNIISQRRRARSGVRGKNKTNIKALCGLCVSAREKTYGSRQGAKHAKVFRVTTKQTLKISAASAPLREK